MPTVIQGFEVYTKPKDTSLESFPVFVQVTGGTQRVVTFPTEFNAIAISLLIENQSAANAARFVLNRNHPITTPSTAGGTINLNPSQFRTFDSMNIVSVYIDATALLGTETVDLFCQVAPLPKTDRQRDPGQKVGSL